VASTRFPAFMLAGPAAILLLHTAFAFLAAFAVVPLSHLVPPARGSRAEDASLSRSSLDQRVAMRVPSRGRKREGNDPQWRRHPRARSASAMQAHAGIAQTSVGRTVEFSGSPREPRGVRQALRAEGPELASRLRSGSPR